jgi:thymidylate synthase ThyX
MLTQERQDLTVVHGYDLPPELVEAGFEREYREAMEKAAEAYHHIYKHYPTEAQYVVPLAYKIRWYNTVNLRGLAWLAELRSIQQGHPNYRKVAQLMYQKVKEVQPGLAEAMMFVDMNDYALGRLQAEIKTATRRQEGKAVEKAI